MGEIYAQNSNKFNGLNRSSIIGAALAGAATLAAYYGFGFAPRFPVGHNLPAMAFFPAIAAANRFGGQSAAWIGALILLLVEALYLPTCGSAWIAVEFVPWYIEFATAICLVTFFLSPQRRKPHAADKGVRQSKRLGLVRNWTSFLLPFSENVVK
jgi:hypothetical protein